MKIKGDLALLYILTLVLILTVYYIGTASLLLTGAKVGQQLGYFLTGKTSSGNYTNASGPTYTWSEAQYTANQLANQLPQP